MGAAAIPLVKRSVYGLIVRMRRGTVAYIGGSDLLPAPLTREEEEAMVRRSDNGDTRARASLIEHNLRLVVFIARKFENTGLGIEDLISIGTIGLIKAVDTFDPAKGKKFASYASRCIENELRMELRRSRKTGAQLSLQEPLEPGGQLTLADTLPDDADMEADCERRADAARLRGMVDALPERERTLLRLRYGFDGAPATQQQTAEKMRISRSYVSRLEKRALKLLQSGWNSRDESK